MAQEINGLRSEKGEQPGEQKIYKGDQFIGWLRRHQGRPGHDPVYRGVTFGGSVGGDSEDRDEALEMLEEAWDEEQEAQARSLGGLTRRGRE